ncbi:MAG: hypothetical protein ACRDZ7_15880 [Acidimicrobiia bacterium]
MKNVAARYDREADDNAADEGRLYEQVGRASESRLAEIMGVDTRLIDAAVLKLVAFLCRPDQPGSARTMDPRLYDAPAWADGLRWVALSGPQAAKSLTKMLSTPVSQHQAKRALDRVFARGLLLRGKHRFKGHATNWFRLDAVAVGKLLDPEGEGAEIRELVRRPRGDGGAGARQVRGACAPTARLDQGEPSALRALEPEGSRPKGGLASQRPPVRAPLVAEFVRRLRDELAVAGIERAEHSSLAEQFDDEWDDPANRGGRATLISLAQAQMAAGMTPADAASLLVHKYPLPVEDDVRSVIACLLRRAEDGCGWSSWDDTGDCERWADHAPSSEVGRSW